MEVLEEVGISVISSGIIGSKKVSDKDGLIDSSSCLDSSPLECHLKKEDTELDGGIGDEIEEVEEEKGCSLNGVLDFCLLLAILPYLPHMVLL